jgi:hypothetical protein
MRYCKKRVGIVNHYRACEPFKVWRREWLQANMSYNNVGLSESHDEAGRDLGDTNYIYISKNEEESIYYVYLCYFVYLVVFVIFMLFYHLFTF